MTELDKFLGEQRIPGGLSLHSLEQKWIDFWIPRDLSAGTWAQL